MAVSIWKFVVCVIAGLGAGISTGLAGLSAAVVIAPMLIAFLHYDQYMAVGISLASDVLASALSAVTYYKNKHIDLHNSVFMMCSTLLCTLIGSWAAQFLPQTAMGNLSLYMTALLGLKFIVRPVTEPSLRNRSRSPKVKALFAFGSGIYIGLVCGIMGAGGGMMLLMALTLLLGYDLKTAVGTSTFIMTFNALVGSGTHFVTVGGLTKGQLEALLVCVVFTALGALFAARFANRTNAVTVNRVTGVMLVILGIAMILVNHFFPGIQAA